MPNPIDKTFYIHDALALATIYPNSTEAGWRADKLDTHDDVERTEVKRHPNHRDKFIVEVFTYDGYVFYASSM